MKFSSLFFLLKKKILRFFLLFLRFFILFLTYLTAFLIVLYQLQLSLNIYKSFPHITIYLCFPHFFSMFFNLLFHPFLFSFLSLLLFSFSFSSPFFLHSFFFPHASLIVVLSLLYYSTGTLLRFSYPGWALVSSAFNWLISLLVSLVQQHNFLYSFLYNTLVITVCMEVYVYVPLFL